MHSWRLYTNIGCINSNTHKSCISHSFHIVFDLEEREGSEVIAWELGTCLKTYNVIGLGEEMMVIAFYQYCGQSHGKWICGNSY